VTKRAVVFLAILFLGCAGVPAESGTSRNGGTPADPIRRGAETNPISSGATPPVEGAKMKSAVMIVAQENFRDEELLQPKEILERNGIQVVIASTTLKEIKGMLGAKVKPDILLSELDYRKFDALIFVGGSGASQYWDDPLAHELARMAQGSNKLVAAICIAPVTLGRAGILKGRRATVWQSEAGQLQALGADYTGRPVEKDANIITAAGPFAAREFGEEISRALLK
jgi:protease I